MNLMLLKDQAPRSWVAEIVVG